MQEEAQTQTNLHINFNGYWLCQKKKSMDIGKKLKCEVREIKRSYHSGKDNAMHTFFFFLSETELY